MYAWRLLPVSECCQIGQSWRPKYCWVLTQGQLGGVPVAREARLALVWGVSLGALAEDNDQDCITPTPS